MPRTRVILVWTGGRAAQLATGLAIVAVVALFVIAIATGTSLLAAAAFAMLVVAACEQFCRRNSDNLTVAQARRLLDGEENP